MEDNCSGGVRAGDVGLSWLLFSSSQPSVWPTKPDLYMLTYTFPQIHLLFRMFECLK